MTDDLRIHPLGPHAPRPDGEFVLYWIQSSLRAHRNPALDHAAERANQLNLPVLAVFNLRSDYPWASDRFHTFLLESVADLVADFARRGIQFACILSRAAEAGDRQPAGATIGPADPPRERPVHLEQLARRAALVVTDRFPTFIVPRQTRDLAAATGAPLVLVDGATVVPPDWHDREHRTARSFRVRQHEALPHFLHPVADVEPRIRREVALDFEPLTPTPATIPDIVAGCPIDHSVPPARAIRGGRHSALRRLRWFVEHALPDYEQGRDDPNTDGTSRLSPYLHFGNLAPQELLLAARDAGPDPAYARLLDETLVWRELGFNFCRFDPRHRSVEAIPAWAREELRRGEADPRPALFDLETLDAAATGEPLWDAAQRAYRVDGWMHNRVRMLWGKTLVQWTRDAAECLRYLEHLNNRWSLDGRDPATWLNLHWILGRYDRPFFRRPIYGTVRYQSLRAAETKWDVGAYVKKYGGAAEPDHPVARYR